MTQTLQRSPDNLKQVDLDNAFAGSVPAMPTSPLYLLGMLLVAAGMVLLPLVYLALIAAAAWGIQWYAVHGTALFGLNVRGRGGVTAVLVGYFGPLIVGVVLLFFMVKPLFARQVTKYVPRRLWPDEQPLLFALVARVAQAVRAPVPDTILVDSDVNASASLPHGLLGLFSRRLTLTIGLPLVSGLTVTQLAGVLAHELGHFRQGMAMRLSYVIRSISFWFTRIVYERDAWDEKLYLWSHSDSTALKIIFYMARFFVFLTRKILWALMGVGHLMSCFLVRQMEYDADRCEACVAGSDSFEPVDHEMHLLGASAQKAYSDLNRLWTEKRLADDLPALILHERRQMPQAVHDRIVSALREKKTGWLDTHPSTRDRVRNATALKAPGIFCLDRPASDLFADYGALCRQVTLGHYNQVLRLAVDQKNLVDVERMNREQARREQSQKAMVRFLQGALISEPHIRWSSLEPPEPLREDLVGQIRSARQDLLDALPQARQAEQAFSQADKAIGHQRMFETFLDAQFRVPYRDFGYRDESAFEASLGSARAAKQQAQPVIDRCAALARRRLLLDCHAAGRMDEALGLKKTHQQMRIVIETLITLSQAVPVVDRLGAGCTAIDLMGRQIEGNREHQPLFTHLRVLTSRVRTDLGELKDFLGGRAFPFSHGQGRITLGDHVVTARPAEGEPGKAFELAEEACRKFYDAYWRCLSLLCELAERVEDALGLERLADFVPPPPADAVPPEP